MAGNTPAPDDDQSSLLRRFGELLSLPAETRNRDNKGSLRWPTVRLGKRFRLELVRDIMAMANTSYGGVLVIGVRDKTHELGGINETDVGTWDQTPLFEAVSLHASPVPRFRVERARIHEKWFVAVEVEEFEEIPCVCKLEGVVDVPNPGPQDGSRTRPDVILRRGALYIRTDGAQTVEIDREELTRDLIARAMARKGDHLVRQIQELVQRQTPEDQASADYLDQEQAANRFLDDV